MGDSELSRHLVELEREAAAIDAAITAREAPYRQSLAPLEQRVATKWAAVTDLERQLAAWDAELRALGKDGSPISKKELARVGLAAGVFCAAALTVSDWTPQLLAGAGLLVWVTALWGFFRE